VQIIDNFADNPANVEVRLERETVTAPCKGASLK
jgi:hypothetical protein